MFGQNLQQQMHREIQADVARGSPDFMHFLQDPGRSGGRGGTRESRSPRPLCSGGWWMLVVRPNIAITSHNDS